MTTAGNRYVQGGGCATVGVAGLVQSGGFGSFSKNYGTAAGGLLEAEVVTADGSVRVVNARRDPDLFWAIRGGGGGTFGIVTRLTLRTHALPPYFGAVSATIRAATEASYRELIVRLIDFYGDKLFNRHWGELVVFEPDNTLRIAMVFQGLTQQQALDRWKPFVQSLQASPERFTFAAPFEAVALPAHRLWDPAFLVRNAPSFVIAADRPGAALSDVFWRGDGRQAGQYLHGYASTWLPESLLAQDARARLASAIFAATRHWAISLHFNKGLAGAPDEALAQARQTSMHPQALDAFALAISSAEEPPAYPSIRGHAPDVLRGRERARRIDAAMNELQRLVPRVASYVSEGDFFAADWQHGFWGDHYPRLRRIKARYDPHGLFVVHHGVGSEDWSADGFSPRA